MGIKKRAFLAKNIIDTIFFTTGEKRNLLYSPDSQLLQNIKKALDNSSDILLEYIDISNLFTIEYEYGSHIFQQAHQVISKCIKEFILSELSPSLTYIDIIQLLSDDLVLFSVLNRKFSYHDLYDLDTRIRIKIYHCLEQSFPMIPQKNLKIKTGHCIICPNDANKDLTYTIFNGLKNSLKNAKTQENSMTSSLIAQFEEIIAHEYLTHLYQPIASLKNGHILGWEALARGPNNSYFHSPAVLFPYAQEIGSLLTLEKLSHKKALQMTESLRPNQKIFINVNSQSVTSLDDSFKKLAQEKGISPKNIVFEITERTAIQDFKNFRKLLSTIRKKGYSIAVDDAGAGYSSLQAIAELQPNFIKLDMSIIHNINQDPVKEALVDTFVTLAKKINSTLIAEGIETYEELVSLINLGVQYGQGYFLGKPAYPREEIRSNILNVIRKIDRKNDEKLPRNTLPIGSIIQSCPIVNPDTPVEDVLSCFQQDNSLEGLVIGRDMVPIGLVMKQNLYNALSSLYGVSLYYKKPISAIMDANPLIVEATTTLEKVSQLATARDISNLYDHIIVMNNGNLVGVVSIRMLLEVITQSKIKMAQYANPLTGLPGNIRIQEEILRIISDKQNMHVTYVDIDEFKKYNDTYGFERGDEILLTFSKILKHVVRKYGDDSTFLGHIGGDDFFLITFPSQTDFLNERIINIFKKVYKTYISTSLATIQVFPGRFKNHLELAEYAAKAKSEAKKIRGCSYIRESLADNNYFFTCYFPKIGPITSISHNA